jgi:hypothetical protein
MTMWTPGQLDLPPVSSETLQMPGKLFIAVSLCGCGIAGWLWQNPASMRQALHGPEMEFLRLHESGTPADPTKASRRPKSSPLPAEKLVEATLSGLQSASSDERRIALDTLLPDLIGKDLSAAADLVKGLEPWASAEEATALLLDHWAESDAIAAAEWCARLDSGEKRSPWLVRVSSKLAKRDPAAAMAMLEEHHLAADPAATGTVLHHWARRDPDAAAEWISRQADEELRDASWNRIALSLSESDPAKAATLAAENISGEVQQEEAVISVLHQWILRDRKAAAAWVDLFPEGPLRQRAAEEFNGRN